MAFYSQNKNQLILTVRVSPNARRSGFDGLWDEALKVALFAPPVDGKANEALIKFLSDFFAVRKSAIEILSGTTSRMKRVSLAFQTESDATRAAEKLKDILS
ncbi:MAG: YggU family protein [Alphaproteobacteria bacterium]|nr:YggU family protein [Alphaproteobacteria bacterium]